MSNSKLVSYTRLSPNHSGARTHSIDRITPHCVVGQLTAAGIAACFASTNRQASCNYGIGTNGDISLIVEECNRSWCSSSSANDQRAVTIECASNTYHPYAMNTKVWKALIKLCVDICKRNGKTKLLWLGSSTAALNYTPKKDEMVLTAHRWFANKACPGDWLYSRYGKLAKKVTKKLGGTTTSTAVSVTASTKSYRVQVTANSLNVRASANSQSKIVTKIKKGEIYTIVETDNGWGKLKSGAGWIYLHYTKKV